MNTVALQTRLCPCGHAFSITTGQNSKQFCSTICRARFYRKTCQGKGICYKCGQPTTDRACNACLVKHRASSNTSRRRLRQEVIAAYGGACVCCRETVFEFLAIDHKNGGGNAHRKSLGKNPATKLLRWLKENKFPSDFRVLCHNCNMARGFYGHCPHELKD